MTNEIRVEYKEIPKVATMIRENGNDINRLFIDIYNGIEDMHSFWYGQRYNELLSRVNYIIPIINQLLEIVVGEMPYTLEIIANNYALADIKTNIAKAVKDEPKKITELSVPNDIEMKFITTEVETLQQKFLSDCEKIKENVLKIDSEYSKITWQSEAADILRENYENIKNKINNYVDNFKKQLSDLMKEAKVEIQKAESANTIK